MNLYYKNQLFNMFILTGVSSILGFNFMDFVWIFMLLFCRDTQYKTKNKEEGAKIMEIQTGFDKLLWFMVTIGSVFRKWWFEKQPSCE